MAVTISTYSHVPKLILNKELDFTKFRVELLNASGVFVASHTAKGSVDNGGAGVTVTISNGSPGVITDTAHGMANGTAVMYKTSGALPTGLAVDTWYYVINQATNTYNVSLTAGGAAINTSSGGSGVHTRHKSGSYEVSGFGWSPGGVLLASPAITQAAITDGTSNDAKLDFDDIEVTAASGTIGPAYGALVYEYAGMWPINHVDFGQAESAGDTTPFKIRINTLGLLNLTQ